MATLTLNFLDLNSSLQVGDYVYYSNITTQGGYQISDAYNENYGNVFLGRVKSIDTSNAGSNFSVSLSSNALPFNAFWQGEVVAGSLNTVKISNVNSSVHSTPSSFSAITDLFKSAVTNGAAPGSSSMRAYNSSGNDAPRTAICDEFAPDASIQGVNIAFDIDFTAASGLSNWFFSLTSNANNGSKKILLSDTTNIEAFDNVVIHRSSDGTNLLTTTVVSVSANNHIIVSDEIFVLNESSGLTLLIQKPLKVVVELENRTDEHVSNNSTVLANTVLPTLPSSSDYFYFVKDKNANSSGVLGYYAQVKLTNNRTDKAELYSVGAEIFESSK